MMLSPLHKTSLIALSGFIAGITLQTHPVSTLLHLMHITWITIVCVILYWLSAKRPIKTTILDGILFLCMISSGYCIAKYQYQRWDMLTKPLTENSFDITGYVTNVAPLTSRPYMAAVHISIESLTQKNNFNDYSGKEVVHYIPLKHAPPAGSLVSITNLKPQRPSQSSDIALFLRKHHVVHQIFNFTDYAECHYINPPTQSAITNPRQFVATWRSRVYAACTDGLTTLGKLYVGLIFFGNKEPGYDAVRMQFSQWGLAHFLARSGLHIVIFVLLITLLLRMIPIHSSFKNILLLIICLLYDALSWSSVSFLRAWILAILIIIRHFLGRHTIYLHLLCLSAIGILACNPCYLFAIDFQLTYALTLALTLFSSLFKANRLLPQK